MICHCVYSQFNFFRLHRYDVHQAEIEYLVKKDSLVGYAKIQFWNFGEIIKYENTLSY